VTKARDKGARVFAVIRVKGARVFAVIGGISSGLKSRERSCPYAFLAPGSGVRVIGGRKFPRAKQQAATQVNLDVASSH
jgi:hypothetical protein